MQNSASRVSLEMLNLWTVQNNNNRSFPWKRARHYFALCVLLVVNMYTCALYSITVLTVYHCVQFLHTLHR